MKNNKLFLIALLVIPWLTVPFLGKKEFKKYLPSAIFICAFTKIMDYFGQSKKWWRFYRGIGPLDSMNFMNLGPYLVTSLWSLKTTYGKFPLYILSNTLMHILFVYKGLKYVKDYGILSLVNLSKMQYLATHFFRALILYGFQYVIVDSPIKKKSFFHKLI